MRARMLILVVFAAFSVGAALPPVGQRRYLIDEKAPFAPVKIEPKDQTPPRATYLKDPMQPGGKIKTPPAKPVKRAPPPPKPAPRAAQLRFKKMPIDGALARPRVEFRNDVLPLERADEPVTPDFFDKVFAPAKDSTY